MLSAFVSESAIDWDEHLPFVVQAYNSSVHSSTGVTPHCMVYGHEMRLPVDLMFPGPRKPPLPSCAPEYVEFLRRALRSAHEVARAHLGQSLIRQKRGYDAHAKQQVSFNPGDLVRYYYPVVANRNKFARPWLGPYTIVEKVTEVDYRIERLSDPKKPRVVHYDNLKPYIGRPEDVAWAPQFPGDTAESDDAVDLTDSEPDLGAEGDPAEPLSDSILPAPERNPRPRRDVRPPRRFGWDSHRVIWEEWRPMRRRHRPHWSGLTSGVS